jgi:plasmid stabilization system protein ParE
MGHVLHDWNLEQTRALLAKAYAALLRLSLPPALPKRSSELPDGRKKGALAGAFTKGRQ